MSRLLHDDSPLDTAPCARWLYRSRRTTLAMSARDTRMTSSRPPSLLRWRPFTYAAQGGRDWSRRQTQGGRHVAHPGGGRRPRGCEASEETAGNALESSWLRSGLYAPHSVAQRRVGRTLEPQSKRRIMGRAQFLTRHLQCHNHHYRKTRGHTPSPVLRNRLGGQGGYTRYRRAVVAEEMTTACSDQRVLRRVACLWVEWLRDGLIWVALDPLAPNVARLD